MPFLGPVIALWVTLSLAVMAYYYLFIARNPPGRFGTSRRDESVPSWREPEEVRPRWGDPPQIGLARSELRPEIRQELPIYDMENFPTDKWSSSTG